MNQPHIAIIDDGINEKLYATGELKCNIQITPEGNICERAGYDTFMPSHGTTCAAIIKKYIPDVILSSVKVLDQDTHAGNKCQLINALQWCMQNGIKLVNLSLGTVDFRDFAHIEKAAGYFAENGGIIVAACNNRNIFTCPASLENVIGVRCDLSKTLKEREFIYNPASPDGIEIIACGSHHLVKYNSKSTLTTSSNSFAAPAVTSMVYDILINDKNISINKLKEVLQEKSYKLMNTKDFTSGLSEFNEPSAVVNKSVDIPIILIYQYTVGKSNELPRTLTEKFRTDGYNALNVEDELQQDICNGVISLVNFTKNNDISIERSLPSLVNVFEPDILIISINMRKQFSQLKGIENHFEPDIKIKVEKDLITIQSTNELNGNSEFRRFKYLKEYSIDNMYQYILSLYGK